MKKHRFLSAALVIALLLALLPCEAFAAETDGLMVGDKQTETAQVGVPVFDVSTSTFVYQEQTEAAVEAQMDEALKNALADDGTCALKDGRYVEYIDRIDIPEEFRAIYDILVEGGDNDGAYDFLITQRAEDVQNGIETVTLTEQYEDSSGNTVVASYPAVVCSELDSFTVLASDLPTNDNSDGGETYQAYLNKYLEYSEYCLAVRAAYDRDHPEVFWTSSGGPLCCYTAATKTDSGDYTFTLKVVLIHALSWQPKYSSESDVRSAIANCYAAADAIVAGAKGTAAWQVKYFNNWLTTHNEYNYYVKNGNSSSADKDAWECISALLGQTGYDGPVCEAYARALKVLCDRAGIPCVLVDGSAKSYASDTAGAHMWNSVEVDGVWYGVDVTWDDPTGGTAGAVSGKENERYLLIGKNTLNNHNYAYYLSHAEENYMFYSSVCFTNGPEIADNAYTFVACTEHSWDDGSVTTAATCGAEGVMTYTCTVCGATKTEAIEKTSDHTWDDGTVTKQPTIAEEGVTTYTCTVCGETKTEAIDKLPAVPQVSVSIAKGSASKKVVLTGKVDNLSDTEDVITGHGLVYITSARLGYKTLTVGTSGRTKVTFGTYKTDGSYSYTITAASKTTRYVVRAWATYTDDSGNSVTVYSDPITFTYNSAQ